MSEATPTSVRVSRRRRDADEWALVLVAEGLTPTLWRVPEGFAVGVVAADWDRADRALRDYQRENPDAVEAPSGDEPSGAPGAGLVGSTLAAALIAFFAVTGPRDSGAIWFERGSAESQRILAGEVWRAVTALTLHADLGHVVANAAAGGFFFTAVFRLAGPGLGIALLLLAGASGNVLNAWLQGSLHRSVGASTAVFGAVGLLGGFAVARRQRRGVRGRRAWVPIAAALGLLAMLGTAGERVDVWAHLSGLGVGGALGLAVARVEQKRPTTGMQGLFAAAALTTVIACWGLALR